MPDDWQNFVDEVSTERKKHPVPNEERGQLILAQNQHAFVQDATKGHVTVYAGPHASGLRQDNDVPVTFNSQKGTYERSVSIENAIKQNPLVPEGHYIVLENPAFDSKGELNVPKSGSNPTPELQLGKKIVIPGPATFALWPGQSAQAIPGHHLRSNQYLVVRVYNADEAKKDQQFFEGDENELVNGQLIVIKGTQMSFFIPPTGYEVLQEGATYVREALTLERLEYCILLDENGSKRYEKGPQVVFPEATEKFIEKRANEDGSGPAQRKFKAVELNDQMGLYIKVIADYEEETSHPELPVPRRPVAGEVELAETEKEVKGRVHVLKGGKWFAQFKTGEELFVTGKEQRIYYPRPEHALIEYDDPNSKGKFRRQRYYGIAIPRGEGRYVLNKTTGNVDKVTGPQIFLPDPRNQVVVRRVLDPKTVSLWYPGNQEAIAYNEVLALAAPGGENFVTETSFSSAVPDIARSLNRLTEKSRSISNVQSYAGAMTAPAAESMQRGTTFTPPPALTLNTKYDGVPTVDVWTGYAVQVVDKAGNRRVEIGPATILLNYDESLEMLSLSTGKPKTTDKLLRDVYLRVDHNFITDIIEVETKDLVVVRLKVSYQVNFMRTHKDKWFAVENYVKYLCDHSRSMLKAAVRAVSIKDLLETAAVVIRDTILGKKEDGKVRFKLFTENGMQIDDVEVLSVDIVDNSVASLLKGAQQDVVKSTVVLAMKQQKLEITSAESKIDLETSEIVKNTAIKKSKFTREAMIAEAETQLLQLTQQMEREAKQLAGEVAKQEQISAIASAENSRQHIHNDELIRVENAYVDSFKSRFAAFTPKLVEAMLTIGKTQFATIMAESVSRMAVAERTGVQPLLERIFAGTPFENILDNLKTEVTALGVGESD